MAWYYQASPHDTHDWDATEVTILVDGTIDGRPRKLLAQANRNGYFFLLDRTNGKPLVVKPFALSNSLQRRRTKGRARAQPGEGGRARRHARVPDIGRRGQFSCAVVQPGHRAVLYERDRRRQHLLPVARRPGSDRPRARAGMARRFLRVAADGARLQDRRAEVAAPVLPGGLGIQPAAGHARDRRRTAVLAAIRPATSSRSTPPTARSSGTRSSDRS